MIDILYCILLSALVILNGLTLFFYLNKKNEKPVIQQPITKPSNLNLSFDECNEIIAYIVDDIYKNKYLLYYRLRDMTIIPEMDEEVTIITKEIISCFSDGVKEQIYRYYTEEYFVVMITRHIQKLLIDYINTYKPSTK